MLYLPARALCKHDHKGQQEGVLSLLESTQGKVSRVLVAKYRINIYAVPPNCSNSPQAKCLGQEEGNV